MGRIIEHFDVFPFTEPARTLVRDEEALLSPAVHPAPGMSFDDIPPLDVVRFPTEYVDMRFSPPRILWESDLGRIEWMQMDFRQPMYHRNLDADEMSYQIWAERTLMTEAGTVELRPGDMVRIPVGVAHDNYGRRSGHILWYFTAPLQDVAPVVRRGEVLIPPFQGWEPQTVNEVSTDCLGGRHCDRAVQLSDETLLLEQADAETERLQVMHPEPSGDQTQWVWKGADGWIGMTSLSGADGRTYTRHRNVEEVQYQVEGTRLLISPNGVVEMTPGTFVHLPVGVAHASITAGRSRHVTTVTRAKLDCVWADSTQSTRWSAQEIDDHRDSVMSPAAV